MKIIRFFILIFIFMGVVGCSSTRLYEGPAKTDAEIVKIRGMSGLDPLGGFTSSLICAVDDKEIDGCATSVEILPGTHRLRTIAKSYGITELGRTIEHEFRAGERYLLGIQIVGGQKVPSLIKDR